MAYLIDRSKHLGKSQLRALEKIFNQMKSGDIMKVLRRAFTSLDQFVWKIQSLSWAWLLIMVILEQVDYRDYADYNILMISSKAGLSWSIFGKWSAIDCKWLWSEKATLLGSNFHLCSTFVPHVQSDSLPPWKCSMGLFFWNGKFANCRYCSWSSLLGYRYRRTSIKGN